jgi:hypothetical protein
MRINFVRPRAISTASVCCSPLVVMPPPAKIPRGSGEIFATQSPDLERSGRRMRGNRKSLSDIFISQGVSCWLRVLLQVSQRRSTLLFTLVVLALGIWDTSIHLVEGIIVIKQVAPNEAGRRASSPPCVVGKRDFSVGLSCPCSTGTKGWGPRGRREETR